MQSIQDIFKESESIIKIRKKLPGLFHIAELESSRAGKIGMEVGSIRERIIVAFLIHKFGEENVETEIPVTEPEIDVKVFDIPISIKTITGTNPTGVKLIWTVDAEKSKEFFYSYVPKCDMIYIHINWNNGGGFYFIPKKAQNDILEKIKRENYIKLPTPGTNPRGIELSRNAVRELLNHDITLKIEIDWKKEVLDFKPFKRWVELWEQE
ncbi:MAG: ThaI family type II restriction endonuclease [Bacteroidales bacterium]|nr:ThaI family type II restriction endonuclease [Bacteroidales bacterium]